MKNYLFKKTISIGFYPFLFLCLIWIVFFIEQKSHHGFTRFGVLPRDVKGLPGIVTSVFIHGGLDHILSNSWPLMVLGMLLFFFYKRIAKQAFIWIWLVSGLWLWIGGRNSESFPTYHIGASTLIYGLATFLFFSGVFRRHLSLMVVSALVVFLYGSMMWGIFPLKSEISWEGHLFGSLAGLLVAFNYRKEGPQRKVYEWENDNDDDSLEENTGDSEHLEPPADELPPAGPDLKINYIYKKDPFTQG
ncbi:MAG: rhomboid family intramembrane serine protease [Bacteroidetes bacterium]|nr:rhomboid family intramembrane serine protease [Bacteroidota bacterium]